MFALENQIIHKHSDKGTAPPIDLLRQMTESLIDGLVEDEESVGFVSPAVVSHLLFIY